MLVLIFAVLFAAARAVVSVALAILWGWGVFLVCVFGIYFALYAAAFLLGGRR